jgi:archaellum biogenesis ATPase FlaH
MCIDPHNLARIVASIMGFIGAAKDYVILLAGLEYLSSNSNFKDTLSFVQFLNDKMMGSNGILLISVDPVAFQKSDVAMLRSEAAGVFEVKAALENQ